METQAHFISFLRHHWQKCGPRTVPSRFTKIQLISFPWSPPPPSRISPNCSGWKFTPSTRCSNPVPALHLPLCSSQNRLLVLREKTRTDCPLPAPSTENTPNNKDQTQLCLFSKTVSLKSPQPNVFSPHPNPTASSASWHLGHPTWHQSIGNVFIPPNLYYLSPKYRLIERQIKYCILFPVPQIPPCTYLLKEWKAR